MVIVGFLAGFLSISATDVTFNTANLSQATNQFRFSGNWIVCVCEDKSDTLFLCCLNLGLFGLGDSVSIVDSLFGSPFKTIPKTDSSEVRAYSLTPVGDSMVPYIVVGHVNGRITSLQLTGEAIRDSLNFSSITLGDSTSHVESILGKPFVVKEVDEIEGVLWSYHPFRFSLEIVNGKVYSIKMYE